MGFCLQCGDPEEWPHFFSTQGDEEIKSDIYTLFFHIVQRIPEYLIHLQVSLAAQASRLLQWTISFGFQISNSIKAQGLSVSKS